jgi:putative ABC transport system substrate-binding protein
VTSRQTFLVTFAGGIVVAPLAAGAQQTAKVPRIGVLVPAEPESPNEPNVAALRRGLRDLGYIDGQNIAVEHRWAHGQAVRLRKRGESSCAREPKRQGARGQGR